MISGKKCRPLNREAVDIRGQEGEYRPAYLTIRWFLRHNQIKRPSNMRSISKKALKCSSQVYTFGTGLNLSWDEFNRGFIRVLSHDAINDRLFVRQDNVCLYARIIQLPAVSTDG